MTMREFFLGEKVESCVTYIFQKMGFQKGCLMSGACVLGPWMMMMVKKWYTF